MRIYLAGPMEGVVDDNFPAFDAAKLAWQVAGHEVVSPADISRFLGPTNRRAAYSNDIPALMTCDAIAVLPGWRKSKGVLFEIHAAQDIGMPIYDSRTPGRPELVWLG